MADTPSDYVIDLWLSEHAAGHDTCLVTLIGIQGSSPRPLGSQIIVSSSGLCVGYITGGCAEAAIKAEALNVIESGQARRVRYGEGSPYKDITLPCGSSLDIYFAPQIEKHTLETIHAERMARRPVGLLLDLITGTAQITAYNSPLSVLKTNVFYRPYIPQLRLYIIGKGPNVPALAQLADISGFDVSIASPERDTLDTYRSKHVHACLINIPQDANQILPDPWTAIALLFHDHNWEYPILENILSSKAFYIGALGSRITQATRVTALMEMNIALDKIERLHAPIGLDIQATSPNEIAVSILADIIKTFRTHTYGPARW